MSFSPNLPTFSRDFPYNSHENHQISHPQVPCQRLPRQWRSSRPSRGARMTSTFPVPRKSVGEFHLRNGTPWGKRRQMWENLMGKPWETIGKWSALQRVGFPHFLVWLQEGTSLCCFLLVETKVSTIQCRGSQSLTSRPSPGWWSKSCSKRGGTSQQLKLRNDGWTWPRKRRPSAESKRWVCGSWQNGVEIAINV